jgi:phosphate transport system substrate-binding protein
LDIFVSGAPFLRCDLDSLCEIRVFAVSDPTTYAALNIDFIPGPGGCPTDLSGPLTGKGTAALARAFASWGPVICESPISVSVDYVAENDTFGLRDFKCALVDYAISDQGVGNIGCLESEANREVAGLAPLALSGISFAFNVRDATTGQRVSELKLTPELLTSIFTGHLNSLDVPAIQALNPGVTLPNKLLVAVRADQSAATLAVTSYMHETSPSVYLAGGNNNEFAGGPTDTYPAISAVEPLTGEAKLLSTLMSPDPSPISDPTVGWIGYLSTPAAQFGALPSVTIVDPSSGNEVLPTNDALLAAFELATKAADGSYVFDFTPSDEDAYPLTTVSSLVVPKLTIGDSRIATFRNFVTWAVVEGQDDKYLPLGYAPLPRELSTSAIRIVEGMGVAASPTPTPTPTPSATTTDLSFGSTDFGTTSGGESTQTTSASGTTQFIEIERLSAFSESGLGDSSLGRIGVFVVLGLFAAFGYSIIRPVK